MHLHLLQQKTHHFFPIDRISENVFPDVYKSESEPNRVSMASRMCALCGTSFIPTRRDEVTATALDDIKRLSCAPCLSSVTSAVTKKEKITKLGSQVTQLQQQIVEMYRVVLRLLRELKGNVEGFREEMREVEDKFGEMVMLQHSKEFREKVCLVIADLTAFRDQLEIKSCSSSPSKCEPEPDDFEDFLDLAPSPEEIDEDVPEEKHDAPSSESDLDEGASRGKSLLDTLDPTGMNDFKREVITRIVKRQESQKCSKKAAPTTSISSKISAFDPRKTHFMTYDPKADIINLEGISVTIDQDNQSLRCLECNFQCKGNAIKFSVPDTITAAYDHILGFHLKLFQCPHCPSNFSNRDAFLRHLRNHAHQFTCDICGRPMARKCSLQNHKWFHLSAEEKEDALRRGVKPPPQSSIKIAKMKGEKWTCDICGKSFPTKGQLSGHNRTHQEPQFVCPRCGKKLRSGDTFRDHLKFVCLPENEKEERKRDFRFECPICLKKLPTRNKLELHKKRWHSEVRAYQCAQCGKAFKTNPNLLTHEKTHSATRQFKCTLGCGATFLNKNNIRRHEKSCKLHNASVNK